MTRWLALTLFAALGFAVDSRLATATDPEPSVRYVYAQSHMGTTFRLVFYAKTESVAIDASQASFRRIRQLDERMSDYRHASALNRLTRTAPSSHPVRIGKDLFAVLEHAQRLAIATDGAFDVTVGPFTKIWRRARRRRELPSAERLSAARKSVGTEFLQLDEKKQTATLLRPNMRLDLGGIAKGYAADAALRELRTHGIACAMVDAGGDIVLADPPPGKHGWNIGIASLQPDAPFSRTLQLANVAVATSGDVWQHVTIDGVRYSHIIDPATGIGLTTPRSVTVIACDGITADALASALSVLGPKKGLALIETLPDAAALIVIANPSPNPATSTHVSKRFPGYVLKKKP